MAAGTWVVGGKVKKYIVNNTVTLGGGIFRMALCRTSASARLSAVGAGTVSTWASIVGEITAQGGYVASGRTIGPATGKWTAGASSKQWKFTMSTVGLAFTASGAALNNVRYAVIRNSTGAAAGKILCYVALSTAQFTISSPNVLTILPAATGIFTLQ